MVKTANEIWRDFNTEGVPASGAHKPIKPDIREWAAMLENFGLAFETKTEAQGETIPASADTINVGGVWYTRTNNGAWDTFTSGDGATWYRLPQTVVRYWSNMAGTPLWADGISAQAALFIGEDAGKNVPNHFADCDDVTGIGYAALRAFTGTSTDVIAIGGNTISQGQPGRHNIAIGSNAGTYLNHSGDPKTSADRNILIGSLAGHFLTSGRRNVLIGRDSGHSFTATADGNVGIGYQANGTGSNPIGLNGKVTAQTPMNPFQQTAVGAFALSESGGNGNTAVGGSAARNIKTAGSSVYIGSEAGRDLDINLSWANKVLTRPAIAGTYSQSGAVITVNATASGAVSGNYVGITFTSGQLSTDTYGDQQWLVVASTPSGNQFTITSPVSKTASGNCTIDIVETAAAGTASATNTIVGERAAYLSKGMTSGTIVGWNAGESSTGQANVLVGQRAGYNLTTGANNTFVGYNAGRNTTAGGSLLLLNNCSCLGNDTRVSGDNQVQLGDSLTTTYVYGTVQNRSDARDKADIADTALGLDFILALRPVDYRWDMRDDYTEVVEEWVETTVTDPDGSERQEQQLVATTVTHPKDGSKKRQRLHHGFIAQDILAVTDQFGGVQDHNINGGDDVLSLGYDELIAPLVKAIQQLTARVAELEAK